MKHIDIKAILKNGASNQHRNLPNFVYTLIAKIIKEDELNVIMDQYHTYDGIEFLKKVALYLNIKIDIEGVENLPEDGRCFFAANHVFGFVDGLVITKIIGEKYGGLKFVGNEMFKAIPNLHPLTIGVNVLDKSPRASLIELNKAYMSNIPITHFPNGQVSRIHKWKVQDKHWQKGFITKAVSGKRDVVPIHFYGRNSNAFYFLYILRKMFFIKSEIEFFLLSREMLKKKNKTIKVVIGKPIPYTHFDKSKSHVKWAQKVKEIVYDL